ncbi:Cadherin-related tumor suppressor [Sergentomyia squamirostris]
MVWEEHGEPKNIKERSCVEWSPIVTNVRIQVLDKNDSPPTFRDLPLTFSVSEDLGAGQSVATLRATDPDTIGTLAYALISGDDNKFSLETDTGILRLRDSLDREIKDVYKLIVRVTDGVQYTETTVTIQVTDTNDNPPIFEEAAYSFDIPENAPRGYQVGIIAASDPDLGANSMLSYTVISDWANDVFSLNPQTGVFTLTARLDYEEVQHYILVVQAQDNGHPSLSTTLTVYCNVLDLNDNAPIFDPMSYSNEIYENVSIATPVVVVSATDIDSGDNGKIEYSITAGDDNQDFEITPSGTIRTRQLLDRETKATYSLVVTARDCAEDPQKRLSSTVQVTVTLKDVNDVAPMFVTANETSVAENIPMNTVVMAIKATDRDEGRNGYIEYLLASEPTVPFTLGTVDGLLRVSGRLDREIRSSYNLMVTARDRGDPPKSTQVNIAVKILDENDNSPVFDPKQYSASIAENASIGAMVLQVSATDIDDGANGRVRFSISGGDDNRDFSISEDSGVVRVAKNLNFERKSRYVLTVRAEDCASDVGSGETRFDSAELTITITDINDNPPTFLDSPYLAYVMENVIPPNGGYVITVKAYDADTPPFNSQVRYFLKEGDADLFRINASTGEISLLRALDRESQAEYTLTLVAMDTGSPPLTGTGTVRVIVQDMNDHSPEFARQSYRTVVPENQPSGTRVLKPEATDKDAGLNGKIRFSLLGEKVERFHVNQENGEVTTATTLNREDTASYHLTLMAQDSSATEPRATAVNLTVIVADVNDNSPVFESASFNVNVPDRIKAHQFVFGARAQDLDEGVNSKIVYSISGKDFDKFTINADTGVIKTFEELSLNGQGVDKVYSLIVKAVDQGVEHKSVTSELTILLKPAHLFPTFSYMADTQFVMPEDVTEGKMITKISATSPKKGPAGNIKYAIAGGNTKDALKIDPSTGEVTVGKGGLDYETLQQYEVWIEAADSDRPSLRSVIKLLINVTDTNDNAPIMNKMIYHSEVMEEEGPPQTVVQVSATDGDSEENGQVTYRLVNDFDGAFEIDSDTGEIFTNMRLDREEVSLFELTVEAVDQGMPQLTGTATVIVTILDKNDNPPRFTRLFSVNVTENAEIGSFVIKVTSSDLDTGVNANATYSFTENPGNKFSIDPISGNVTVTGHLDREQQDEYLLKVAAVDGAWRAETPLTITIQDQNDNAPEFEHSYYSFNFPELQRAVAFVGQVTATDRDKQGPNSVISYSLQQPSDLFSIDPATGDVFSKRTIHYRHTQMEASPENMYALTVLATDNGKPPMYSECLVNINVVDANNNPPRFEQHEYLSPVPEDAQVGQRVVQVVARDELDFGINAEVDYTVIGGNGTKNFGINKQNGWITVLKPLQNLLSRVFSLHIRAVDRGVPPQQDETTVTIVVTGDNRFAPVFTALSYQVIVPENEPTGSTILIVSASDNDDGPNGMVKYSISGGNERKEFHVHPTSGAITILQSLDYDVVQEYHLNITAEDLGFKSKSAVAMLTVTLTDINDNAPIFNQTEYHAHLPENSPPNSFVYRARATDRDSPKNAVILYSIVSGSGKDLFAIDHSLGVITSKASFDYEEENLYTLNIMASNPDSPMSTTVKVFIHITGVNEFYPRFIQPVFHFDVSESAEVGTSVGVIEATDKDSGDDGKVYYLLVGSSNDKGFGIHPETGVMYVARNLDRETQSRVVLTVMAKNFGGIRGNDTDEAQVIISIQDGNDPPEFVVSTYEANVSEGAQIGVKVVTVKAVDKDIRPQNNQFSYSIIGGNSDQSFKVDPQTGHIETSRKLDRESTPEYSLTIGAIDTGVPPQTGTAMVHITVTDINDNGPVFDPADVVGYVTENEPAGTSVMTLTATDPDLPPNGAPFTYYLIGGRHKSLVTVEKHSGLMKTTRSFDREVTPVLDLIIEVEDNGKPRMRSQHAITVNVKDENDSPSTPRVVHVLVHAFNGRIPIGKIANVHPNDLDIVGDYRCKILTHGASSAALQIPNGCNLHTTPKTQSQGYSYSVSGNDGRHADVVSTVSVEFLFFDNITVENSITIRIDNVTASQFLGSAYRSFLDLMKSSIDSGDELNLYSLRDTNSSLELTIAVKNIAGYRSPLFVVDKLTKKRQAMVQLLQSNSITIGYTPCNQNTCDNGGVCSEKITVNHDETRITDSQALIFTSPLVNHEFRCRCVEGYTGVRCDKRQDPCTPNPCQSGGECRRQGYDFQCHCPPHREGKFCQLERGDACSSNPCNNGGSCRESPDGSSFFCLCRPGYRGNNCETIADSCRPNPCLHGGLCVSLKPGYKCSCVDGRYGRHCERATFGFQELSFLAFPSLNAATNDISIIFATTKPDALLVYNYGHQSGGRSDFVAMEIVKGKAVFSFGGSRTAITSVVVGGPHGTLSNGKWHKVTATRNEKVMSLSVSKCDENGDVCDECRPGDATCYSDDIGPTGTLNFNKQPLLIGGLMSADPVLERPGQVHSDDLIGCVHSVSINGRPLNLTNPLKSRGVVSTCSRNSGGPCSRGLPGDPSLQLCGSFGSCMDRWHTAMCRCGGDLFSPDCYQSLDPISLGEGGFIEFQISEKHRRMQLLEHLYSGASMWNYEVSREKRYTTHIGKNITTLALTEDPPKSLSILFRTLRPNGLIFFAATNKHFTSVELRNKRLVYHSQQSSPVNMTDVHHDNLADGKWHNITLHTYSRVLHVLVDGKLIGDELDSAGVHDFLDPYLTVLSVGGVRRELVALDTVPPPFEGCFANFTINNEIQPFNGSGSIFPEVQTRGKVYQGCHGLIGLGSAQVTDPLSIGITLVIVFFVILLVAIFASFIVFRLRKQQKEKSGGPGGPSGMHSKQNGGPTLLGGGGMSSAADCVMGRGLHGGDPTVGFHTDNGDLIRGVGGHHLVGPELISKKYKEREISSGDHHRPQRPDIIEREVVSKSPPLREDHHPPIPPPNQHHPHDHPGGVDMGSEFPEHYDLENASSIAPSDIDIVYHYKGYREAGGVRKYKATAPPVASYTHHKHQAAAQQQHRHSPHHAGPYGPRVPPTASAPPTSTPRQHQSTPLARLSPSSELSSQQPRILTLHDISGKPLQSALLATTSSSGGVGKDALHSNSERSLNSPVMSQLSGQSSSASRKNPGPPPQAPNVKAVGSLTAEEIERLNVRPRTSSLVSTLDAVSSSSEAPRVPGAGHHLAHLHHSPAVDTHSSTSTDESGNDSFTCSEIEYDNNSLSGDKYSKPGDDDDRRGNESGAGSGKPPIPPPSYDGFDSSFRGSLSTLVASDDDLSTHMGGIYRQPNGASPSATTALGWDYLLNWGPNFESLMGVFKDIAELPDSVNGHVQPLRLPSSMQKPSEEYV